MRKIKHEIVGIGEVLWDILPAGRQLGGAPTNFAYHVNSLGETGIAVSRVGDDDLGKETVERLQELDMDTGYIQIDRSHPTGTVPVQLNEQGEPIYIIVEDVAWDYLEWSTQLQRLSSDAQVVCFGTLAQRTPDSRHTIRRFLRSTNTKCLKIFDINLRQSYFSQEILIQSMKLAQILKLSHEELPVLVELLGKDATQGNEKDWARYLIDQFVIELVCITRGANGSVLVTEHEIVEHAGYQVKVVDTVGSGDAFTACLAVSYLRSYPLDEICKAANRLGAWVAGQAGATPPIGADILQLFD